MPETFSLHKIDNWDDFGFSPADYSRFKFGDESVAKAFGKDLAKSFIEKHLRHMPVTKPLVVLASPYSYIPTATFAMKIYFMQELNRWLCHSGHRAAEEAKVHRSITYKEDYGELNAEERLKLIGNDIFHIDKEFVRGKTLIFLDDIRITGGHERMILKMVNEYRLENKIHLLYFAELVNHDIHPNIENHLNYFSIKSIFDLTGIIRKSPFAINTRIVKYILNYEFSSFCIFLDDQDNEFIDSLYHMAIGNNYHTIPAYSRNLNYINEYLFANNYKELNNGN